MCVQEALAAGKTVHLFNSVEEVEAIGLIPEVLPAPEAPDLNLLSLHPSSYFPALLQLYIQSES